MEGDKYELIRSNESDFIGFRVRALRDITKHGIRRGEIGGLVSNEKNLSQDGDGWIDSTSKVIESTVVINGYISNGSTVAGNSYVRNGVVKGSKILGSTVIDGDVQIQGSTVENCRLIGRGIVSRAHLTNCVFLCPFKILFSGVRAKTELHVTESINLEDVSLNIGEGEISAELTMERTLLKTKKIRVKHTLFMKDAYAEYKDKFRIGRMEKGLQTDIQGEKGNPIQLWGGDLLIDSSIIRGSMLLSGNLEIRSSILSGMHHIHMKKGYIQNTQMFDCVTINQTSPQVQVIVGKTFDGDLTIDYDQH